MVKKSIKDKVKTGLKTHGHLLKGAIPGAVIGGMMGGPMGAGLGGLMGAGAEQKAVNKKRAADEHIRGIVREESKRKKSKKLSNDSEDI